MATMNQLADGTLVNAGHWNAHVDQINTNTTGISTLESRTTNATTGNTALGNRVGTLETNQGTRGTNGTVYAELGTLKTNQGTRGTRGTVYDEVNLIRSEIYGGATRTGKPKCTVAVTNNGPTWFQTLNYGTDTMLNWETEVVDTDAMFTPGQSGITVPVDGLYLSVVSVNLAAQTGTVTGSLAVKLFRNTTEPNPNAAGNVTNVLGTNTAPWNYAGEGPVVTMSNVVQLTAGTVLRMGAWHNFNNGANLNVGVKGGFNAKGTTWSITYLGK